MCQEHHHNLEDWAIIDTKDVTAELEVDLVEDMLSETKKIQSEHNNLSKDAAHLELCVIDEPILSSTNHSSLASNIETFVTTSTFHPKSPVKLTEAAAAISPENDPYLKDWDWVIVDKKEVLSKAELVALVAKLQSKNNALNQDKLEMLQKVESLINELASSQSQIMELESSIEKQEASMTLLNHEINELKDAKMKMQYEHESKYKGLNDELKSSQGDQNKYKMLVKILEKVNEDSEGKRLSMMEFAAKLQFKNKALSQANLDLSDELATSQSHIMELEDYVEQQKAKVALLRHKIIELQDTKLEKQHDDVSNLKRHQNKYKMLVKILEKVNEESEGKIMFLVARNTELLNKAGSLENVASALQETVASMRAENAKLVEKMGKIVEHDFPSNKAVTFDDENEDLSNHQAITPKSKKTPKKRRSSLKKLESHNSSPINHKLRPRASLTPRKLNMEL